MLSICASVAHVEEKINKNKRWYKNTTSLTSDNCVYVSRVAGGLREGKKKGRRAVGGLVVVLCI